MNMPGFNAEASLGKTNGSYRMVGSRNNSGGSRGVLPQLPIGFCMANCDHIQDDFMRSVCNLNCLGQGGGGGGGGGGAPTCRPGCSTCKPVAGQPGRWKTCIRRNCDDYEVRCG